MRLAEIAGTGSDEAHVAGVIQRRATRSDLAERGNFLPTSKQLLDLGFDVGKIGGSNMTCDDAPI